MSGVGEGCVCSKSRVVSPGSGRDSGDGIDFATSPSFSAAWNQSARVEWLAFPSRRHTCWTWVMLIVGFPPFALTKSSGS